MHHTNGMTTLIEQEQSDLVTSATLSNGGGGTGCQKDSINLSACIITPTNINKNKITTIINSNNKTSSKSNNNHKNTILNNNNSNSTTNKKNNSNNDDSNNSNSKSNVPSNTPNGCRDHQHTINSSTSSLSSATLGTCNNGKNSSSPDARQVLKEAVDAVVNSFTKHTQGYGRGMFKIHFYHDYIASF